MKTPDWFAHMDRFGPENSLDPAKDRGDRTGPTAGRREMEKAPVQDRLDLHGLTLEESKTQLARFIAESRRFGYTKVLVIHGKGLHSPGGASVLKTELKSLFKRMKGVEASGEAPKDQGGQGATWLWLRKDN